MRTGGSITNKTFLEAAFADMLGGTHTVICGFRGDPNTQDREQSRRNWCGQPWRLGDRVPRWFDQANAYFTIATFEPDPQTGELRRRKSEFSQSHVIMVDDVGTKVPHTKLCLPPSALIETSPENFQACYFIRDDADARDRQTCERLIHRMIGAGLAVDSKDPGMAGVTRYARLPVGINTKRKYVEQLGGPFAVRLVRFEPALRYSILEIASAYKLDMTEERPKAPVFSITPAIAKRAGERFDAILDVFKILGMYRGQHGYVHEVQCPWVDTHTERADTGSALLDPSDSNNFAGGYVCFHGHCRGVRGMKDIRAWIRSMARARCA